MNEELEKDLIDFDEFPSYTDLDDDDDIFGKSEEVNNQNLEKPEDIFDDIPDNNDSIIESDLLSNLLNQKGITNPNEIEIEDESGELLKVKFNDLPLEEQLEILSTDNSSVDLDDSEIETINFLRENDISLEQLIEYHRNLAIQQYLEENSNINYTVDQLSDEELYKIDIKSRFEHFTDEEIDAELQKELNSPDLFKKKVDKLRDLYKREEEEEYNRLNEESQVEQSKQREEVINLMVEAAQDTNELFDLELEDNDKEEVLQFLLEEDINGQSEFTKILNDPKRLFEIAWFALKGQEAFNTIHDYYRKEIDSVRKASKGTNLTSRKTIVKKETPKEGYDPYDLKEYLTN